MMTPPFFELAILCVLLLGLSACTSSLLPSNPSVPIAASLLIGKAAV